MHPTNPKPRRRPRATPSPEALEARGLLTGGAGNTFALVLGTITEAGGAAAQRFTIDPNHFSKPSGQPILGIDITGQNQSSVDPRIVGVDAAGTITAQGTGGARGRRGAGLRLSRGPRSNAVLATMDGNSQPAEYSVRIAARRRTSGGFLIGFFLPGDVDGNGVVEMADVDATRAALGARADQTRYVFDADANRDGRITRADVTLTRRNLGARTNVTPVLTADLDPASAGADRVSTTARVRLTGTATPGASITYADVAQQAPTAMTTADAAGAYSIELVLTPGSNTFRVTSTDAFGQTISGQIAPVTYRVSTAGATGSGA